MLSVRNATANPTVIPNAASAAIQTTSSPIDGSAGNARGHNGNRAKVKPRAKAARAGFGPAVTPGRGTNTSAPLTRASTSRKPKTALSGNAGSAGIAAQ